VGHDKKAYLASAGVNFDLLQILFEDRERGEDRKFNGVL
jgi:hypothetical protein